MLTILLVAQVIIAVAMVALILIQKTSSDGMAGLSGGGNSGGNSLISGRASANILTKSTAFLAMLFMVNSLAMAIISARSTRATDTIINNLSNGNEKEEVQIIKEDVVPSVPIAE